MLHSFLHFSLPMLLALAGAYLTKSTHKNLLKKSVIYYVIMIATMAVDVDHLLATPIYDAQRCSLGFHPLHQAFFITFYALLTLLIFHRKRKVSYCGWAGLGLILHMLLDGIDCYSQHGYFLQPL